eukprot:3565484-Lingulodinium_polyedra.AAC.1
MEAASAGLEGFRLKQLSLKPPTSRVQSVCQRRGRAKQEFDGAEGALAVARWADLLRVLGPLVRPATAR